MARHTTPSLLSLLLLLSSRALSAPVTSTSASASGHLSSLGPVPSYSASASIPSSSAPLSSKIQIPTAADLPPKQPTCVSDIFCPGSAILHTVELAQIFSDSKTFVDRPTNGTSTSVLSSWANLTSSGSITVEQLEDWVEAHFIGEGQDLQSATIEDFNTEPAFLGGIKDEWLRGWAQIVNGYWRNLARSNVQEAPGSEATLIRLNHSFIIAGGRFRESYYWDSKWIVEGLLIGGIKSMASNMIQNFIDEVNAFGMVPNGARKYYLNRSQPPLFTQIVWNYLESTGDTSILSRALPALEKEMAFWANNRTTWFKSPHTGRTYQVSLYNVSNSAPRPEGYLEDWQTAYGEPTLPLKQNLTAAQRARLWSMLASGAESGNDYASRWVEEPLADPEDNDVVLRTLNIDHIIPVDLNSILARNFYLISQMYLKKGSTFSYTKSKEWSEKAEYRKEAVLDLFWDESRLSFYDFNVTANSVSSYWAPASFYPYWSGIWPPTLNSEEKTQKAFAPLGYLLSRFNGTLPDSLLDTGLQWDAPDSWPSHVYILANAVANIPSWLATKPLSSFTSQVSNFSYLSTDVFGHNLPESSFPVQTIDGSSDNLTYVPAYGDLGNLGNLTELEKGNWRDGLQVGIAQRYIGSAFCSWYATGGSIPGVLDQLPTAQLNASNAIGVGGLMFEKFSMLSLNQAGVGGEYTVQDGFGWTNGVVASFTSTLGSKLQRPDCPPIYV